MNEYDLRYVNAARRLAKALIDYGYDRRPEDQRTIAEIHTEICKLSVDEAAAARKGDGP